MRVGPFNDLLLLAVYSRHYSLSGSKCYELQSTKYIQQSSRSYIYLFVTSYHDGSCFDWSSCDVCTPRQSFCSFCGHLCYCFHILWGNIGPHVSTEDGGWHRYCHTGRADFRVCSQLQSKDGNRFLRFSNGSLSCRNKLFIFPQKGNKRKLIIY